MARVSALVQPAVLAVSFASGTNDLTHGIGALKTSGTSEIVASRGLIGVQHTWTAGADGNYYWPVPTRVAAQPWTVVMTVSTGTVSANGILQIASSSISGAPFLYLYTSASEQVGVYVAGGYRLLSPAGTWKSNSVNTLVLTYDGTGILLYINGVYCNGWSSTDLGTNGSNYLWLGQGYAGTEPGVYAMVYYAHNSIPPVLAHRLSINPWQLFLSEAANDAYLGEVAAPSGTNIACNIGAALATGIAANIPTGTTINAAVGAAVATGATAGVASSTTIAASAGSAGAAGAAATVVSPITITATAANGAATGGAATIASAITVVATLGGVDATALAAAIHAPQMARPANVISSGTWTASEAGTLAEMLDEVSASDADFISTVSASTCEVALGATSDPASSAGHVLRYRIEGTGGSLTVRLMCGAVEIASWVESPPPGTFDTIERTLSGAQADAITNYGDLRVQFEAA